VTSDGEQRRTTSEGTGAGREPDAGDPVGERTGERAVETAWERRRRLDAVFGDVLPDTTSDERGDAPERGNDEWLRRQVPPHHG
jgi:hypothetical protein